MVDKKKSLRAVGAAVALLVALAVLRPLCTPTVVVPPDPNEALARTAQDAIALARDSRDELAALRSSFDRWYFVSLALCVTAPVVVAAVVLWSWSRTPPAEHELLAELEELRLIELPKLGVPPAKQLTDSPEEGESVPSEGHE